MRVEIFETGPRVFEPRLFEQTFDASRVAPGGFAIDEQAEALLETQPMAGGLNELFFEGARHAVELQALEAG